MQHLNYLTIYYFANNSNSLENDYLLLLLLFLFEKTTHALSAYRQFFVRLKGFLVHLTVKFVPRIS